MHADASDLVAESPRTAASIVSNAHRAAPQCKSKPWAYLGRGWRHRIPIRLHNLHPSHIGTFE